ncbi:magnesium-translocating P-type ATPase [soil metagenome]
MTGLFLRQFASPLIWILIGASVVAGAVGDWTNAIIVIVIVIGSGGLGFVQEYRASDAVEKLRDRVRIVTSVVRDGVTAGIPVSEVVPGDIVLLSAGSLIPADGVVIEANDFFVTETVLTGEPLPVEKHPGVVPADTGLARRTNAVFMGTSVRSGTARVLIARTGEGTAYGAIAEHLRVRPPETEFARGVRRYGYLLTEVMLTLTFAVFAANVLLGRPPIDSLLFSIALAVGLSPELLPAIISMTLSWGARDMAAHGVIVRRLDAIENLGGMDVLCTDKTGTITEGAMALDAAVDAAGTVSAGVLRLACINAGLQTGLANALDEAISARDSSEGVDIAAVSKLDEIPYDFVRKRLSVVVDAGGAADKPLIIAKGALAGILDICDRVRDGQGDTALDADRRAAIQKLFEQWSADGVRVLGLATREVAAQQAYGKADETGLVFEGFLRFLDPPKKGIRETLAALSALGVRLKVITGDNRLVSIHLAATVGLQPTPVLTGTEIDRLGTEALWRAVEETDLFVEVDPGQKEKIILALKRGGHVVGFLGDGINDAPALHVADVGISVDKAVDVAKAAADFVLLASDLAVLKRGIEQGRATFANTLKYISITTSANFGNMISMAVASLFLPFLPLLAKQILLNNFLSDFPALAIAGDNVDRSWIERPHRWDISAIRSFMIVFGLVSSLFDFATFGVLMLVFHAGPDLFRSGWFVESLMTELVIALVIRTHQPFYLSRPGRALLVSTLVVIGVTIALPYLPISGAFGFVPLPAPLLAGLLLIVAGYVAATEVAKLFFYRDMR